MSEPKQHHYVPEWYLKRFSDRHTGRLHVYDKKNERFFSPKPRQAMKIGKYYTQEWAAPGIDPNILERFFSEMESKAKSATDRLLAGSMDYSQEEIAALLLYMEVQWLRVPKQADTAEDMHDAALLMHANKDFMDLYFSGNIVLGPAIRFEFMKCMIGLPSAYFARMHWDIAFADDACGFITSDNPMVFFNVEMPPPMQPGIRFAGTRVIYPLSEDRVLIMRHPEFGRDTKDPRVLVPEPANADTAISISFWPRTETVSGQTVSINRLIAASCQRFIAGNSKRALEGALRTL